MNDKTYEMGYVIRNAPAVRHDITDEQLEAAFADPETASTNTQEAPDGAR